MLQEQDIEKAVLTELAEVLDRASTEIEPDASLLVELGAESLDLLDLAFRLEKRFSIALPRANMLQHAEGVFGPAALADNGVLTELGLRVLAAMRPEVAPERFVPGLRLSDVAQHITPRTFVRLVEQLLAAKQAFLQANPRCHGCDVGQLVPSQLAPELSCAACGFVLPLPSGDSVLIEQLQAVRKRLAEC